MSRGLQMLVEEGSIPHAFMLCGASGSKTAHGFCRNERRETKPATVFCRNRRREQKNRNFLIE